MNVFAICDKHSSLLRNGINYEHKKFYDTGPCLITNAIALVIVAWHQSYETYCREVLLKGKAPLILLIQIAR